MNHRDDDIYKALADEHRRTILAELCQKARRAGELARHVGLAPNAISFHLRLLRSAGLVTVNREGRFLWYSVAPKILAAWQNDIRQQFSPSLGPGGIEDQEESQISAHRPARKTKKKPSRPSPRKQPKSRPSPPRYARSENIATDTLPAELL